MFWTMAAWAGGVYINGVQVEPSDLAGMDLTGVSVRMGADGSVRITAPGYTVRPAGTPAPPMPGVSTAQATPPKVEPGTLTVPGGQWWLYMHDKQSTGHRVTVIINDMLVKTAASGEVVILDIGRWLQPGSNAIRIEAQSTNPTGGLMYAYLGRGSDDSGTVDLGVPDIQFSVGRSKQGLTQQEYTLEVHP